MIFSTSGTITNNLLDAIPCSWSSCYSDTLAKSIGIAINDDNNLLSWDGTYWKYGASYVKNHTITGNSYTTSNNEAIKPSTAVGWAATVEVWYDNPSSTKTKIDAYNYCIAKGDGWRLTTSTEFSSIPAISTWNYFYNNSYTTHEQQFLNYGSHLYIGSSTGSIYPNSNARYFRCIK